MEHKVFVVLTEEKVKGSLILFTFGEVEEFSIWREGSVPIVILLSCYDQGNTLLLISAFNDLMGVDDYHLLDELVHASMYAFGELEFEILLSPFVTMDSEVVVAFAVKAFEHEVVPKNLRDVVYT